MFTKTSGTDDTENKNKKIQAAIYARVFENKQDENLNRQVKRLRQYCKDKGYEKPIEFIEISSESGSDRQRFHKMIDAVSKRKINLIVVENKNRFSRYGLRFIYHFLKSLGCRIETVETEASEAENKKTVVDVIVLILFYLVIVLKKIKTGILNIVSR